MAVLIHSWIQCSAYLVYQVTCDLEVLTRHVATKLCPTVSGGDQDISKLAEVCEEGVTIHSV